MSRIGIDARIYGAKRGGIGRYTEEFLRVLPEVKTNHTFVVLMRNDDMARYNPNARNIEKVCADAREYSLKEQIVMPLLLHDTCVDLLHVPHIATPYFWHGPTVLTAHDLIEYKYKRPEATSLSPWMYELKHNIYRRIVGESLSRARAIVAVSRFAKGDIQRHFPSTRVPIHVIHPGLAEPVRQAFLDLSSGRRQGKPLRKPYLLYVGNAAPHKNVERLFGVYRACMEKDKIVEHLVMVMPDDFHTKKFSALVSRYPKSMQERVHIVSGVDERDLFFYYKHANLLVSASKEEGYGMPFAEALAHGTPVLAGFVGALPEFSSHNIHYWDTKHIPNMRNKLVHVLHKWDREESIPNFPSWQKVAEQIVEVYNSVL
ncbi:MAG: glycosyltransferase family 4 protein [Candidatus Spechtbacteria bacterium]|nr:glycosyltransferase family 4 protein [Candidatus Spechtbacteria bacterium]